MAEWIISGNPQNYDVVGAFHELKRVDWTQSANIDVGDIVYIYVSGDIKMLLFKCRANKVNITVPDIEDQKFNVSGKYDGHMGRYMELEMLEEFDGPEYSREELIKHGFQSPMGPMHMPDSVSEYLEGLRNYSQSSIGKYSVSSSVWIATALMAANVYSQNINADREKYYFKQSEIREKAQEYANGKVEPARISWWCCADGPKNTYNYLRADNENDNTLRRLTSPVELDGIKTLPTDLSPSLDDTIFYILGHDFSLEDLFTFVQEKYSKIWEDENEWWPSLTEYDPEISSKQWFRLLKDESVTSHETLVMLKMMLELGGESTCEHLAEVYGGKFTSYRSLGRSLGEKVYNAIGCTLCKDDKRERYYTIPFVGRRVIQNGKSRYSWKMRTELEEALKEMNLDDFDIEQIDYDNLDFDHNMILYGPPGTGKTYNSVNYAVAICEGKSIQEVQSESYDEVLKRYKSYKEEGRIAFTTFHQSYGYEEFIEGIKPVVEENESGLKYKIEPGVFKKFCDEINKGKISNSSDVFIKDNPTVWVVILDGTGKSDLKKYCFENGEIRIGWTDWPKVITEDTERLTDKSKAILLDFQDNMEIGDIVLVEKSNSSIDGIGIITGDCIYDEAQPYFCRTRKVHWFAINIDEDILALNGGVKLARKSTYALPESRIDLEGMMNLINKYAPIVKVEPNEKTYVFIIDEINRGNISKIFGELITLIESTKRKGAAEEMSAILPYSGEAFSVPSNVYILGTMNTADRSIALMDTALRRRFKFTEMMPDSEVLNKLGVGTILVEDEELDVAKMLDVINQRIEYLFDREHTIGHAFFTKLADDPSIETLANIFSQNVIPLLQEYFYEDYEKIQLVLGDNTKPNEFKFILDSSIKVKDVFNGNPDIDLPEKSYIIQTEAFYKAQSYKLIGKEL